MADQYDRQFLLSIFLMEAWDTVTAVEEGLGRLVEPATPTIGETDPLVVVTHRLQGAAGLNGFPGVAELARVMLEAVEGAADAPVAERRRVAAWLGEAVGCLKSVLEGISATGGEDSVELTGFIARHPAPVVRRSSSEIETGSTGPAEPGRSAPLAQGSEALRRELDRFFSENQEILTYFGLEAAEHLEVMTTSALALERTGPTEEELATLFRAVHTLKGAAYTVGCTPVGALAHQIEDLLGEVRGRRVPVTPAVTQAVFEGIDALKLLLRIAEDPSANLASVVERTKRTLSSLMPGVEPPTVEAVPVAPVEVAADSPIDAGLEPSREIELVRAAGPAVRLEAARAETSPVPEPVAAGRVDEGRRKDREGAAAATRRSTRVSLERLDSLMNLVGELVIARSRLDRRLIEIDRVSDLLRFTRFRMVQAVRDFEQKHEFTQLPRRWPPDGVDTAGGSSRVTETVGSAARLFADLELDRYDDFNILARRVAEISADLSEIEAQLGGLVRVVSEDTSQIQRLTTGLRSEVSRARMQPIGTLFTRFARQVRETAKTVGKTVVLEASGKSVEMDSTILDQMIDPILHLVQNAIFHGIEGVEERRARGKPSHGTLYLRAYHQGDSVYLEVEDDGRGMDVALMKELAVSRGLLEAEAARRLSDREALSLVFLPGFSTASTVTAVAGRGVGLDVVRTNVSRLNGEIDIETEVGVGTRFTLRLPLTVLISEALIVRVGTETLAIPLTPIRLIRTFRPEEILSVGEAEMVTVQGEPVDLIRMNRVLGLPPSGGAGRIPVVVLHVSGRTVAVAVNELLGKQEIVIKRLGELLERGLFAGATISGEGRVILVIDALKLLEPGMVAPLAPGETVASQGEVARATAEHPPKVGRRVMLVDDSISIRKFVGQMLERAGFDVLTATDGADALRQLEEVSVDAVITDLEMPRVNGYELIENLRRHPSMRDVPVVILTTRAGEKHVKLAQSLGVNHYVLKPVDEQAFVRLIDSLTSAPSVEAALSGAAR